MKKFIIIILSLIFSTTLFAQNQDANALFKKANDSYSAKDYQLAAELYEQIIAQGYQAPELNYNLANAYYKQEKYTSAILNYERALKQNRNFDDAKNNLQLANLHLTDQLKNIPETNFAAITERIAKGVGVEGWGTMCLIFLTIGLGLFLFYYFSNTINLKKFSFSFGFVFVVLSIIALLLGFYSENINKETSDAIITSNVVTAKSSPDESSTDLFRIHEGLKVTIKDKSLDWIEIKLSDGRVGWVKNNVLEKI